MMADRMALDYQGLCLAMQDTAYAHKKGLKDYASRKILLVEKDIKNLEKRTAMITSMQSFYNLDGPHIFYSSLNKLKAGQTDAALQELDELRTIIDREISHHFI